ncbi:hypothetical protein [Humidesulfovibrio sp.]
MIRRILSPLVALCAALALAALLAGCFVPQSYSARIKIERSGTYHAYMEGTALHPETWHALRRVNAEAKAGKFKEPADLKKAKDEALAPLAKQLEALKDDKRVQSVSPIGDGRVRFSVGGTWELDRSLLVLNKHQTPISYAVAEDGSVRLRVKDAIDGPGAKALGVVTDGSLAITVAEGVEVLEHNAQRTPTTPQGAYRWTIGPGSTQAPYLKLRFPATEEAAEASPAASQPTEKQSAGKQAGEKHPGGTGKQSPAPTPKK